MKEPELESAEAMLLAALETPVDKRTDDDRNRIKAAYEAADAELVQLRADKKEADDRLNGLRRQLAEVMVMQDMGKPRKRTCSIESLHQARRGCRRGSGLATEISQGRKTTGLAWPSGWSIAIIR